LPVRTDIRASASTRTERASGAAVREWYAGSFRSRLAQAVADGRADAGRATELHRLMTELLEPERPAADVEGVRRMDGRVSL
jgi:hypothetical protein